MANIVIQVDALTEAANAKIQGFFSKLDISAKALDKSLATSTQSLLDAFAKADAPAKAVEKIGSAAAVAGKEMRSLGAGAMGTTSAMRLLNDVSLLMGGTRLREITYAAMGASAGMRLLRSATTLTGLSMGTLIPVIGGIAAAVGGAAWIWHEYSSETARAAEEQKKLMESLQKLPHILSEINTLMKAGRVTPSQANEWADYLTGRKKLYKTSTGEITKDPAPEQGPSTYLRGVGFQKPQVTFPKEASPSEVQDYVSKKLEGKGGMGDPEVQAVNILHELKEKIYLDSLSGLKKEEAEIHSRYKLEQDAIEETLRHAGTAAGKKEREQAAASLQLSKTNEASAIESAREKKRDDDNKKSMEEEAKIDQEAAKKAADARKILDEELTIADLEAGKKRGNNYQEEFSRKTELYKKQLDAESSGEDEYTELFKQATIKRLEGINKEAEETKRLQEAEAEINLARVQGQRHLIESDPSLSQAEKKEKLLVKLREESALLEKNLAIYEAMTRDTTLSPEAHISAVRKVEDTQQRHAQTQQEISTTASSGTFSGEMKHAVTEMQDQFGSVAKQIALTFKNVIGTAVDTVSKSLTGVIMGTEKWSQALKNISGSVLNQLISSIIKMGIQYVTTHSLMGAAMTAFHALGRALGWADTAEKQAQTAAAIPGQTTEAALTSVSSYGAAAGIGAAALIAAMASMSSNIGGQYAEGGRPRPGMLALVGERGPELFIPDVPGTILPADETSAALRHGGGRAVPGSTTLRNDNRVSLTVHDDRQNALDAFKTAEGRKLFVQLSKEHKHEIG